jgi:protein-S-isoprenylcysteine O-methyltransferase Ste14
MSIAIITPFAILAGLSVPLVKEESVADFLLSAAGWVCFFAGATFRWWATLYVGGRKDQELAVDGPYSVCRNPLYLGTFLLTLSIAFFVHSLMFAIGLFIATPLYLWVTVPWEEARLKERFGERYEVYRARVPKFIPSFLRLQSPATIPVSVSGLAGEFRISARWIWIPLLAEAFAHLRMESWWPDVLHLP